VSKNYSGGCFCGAIEVEVSGQPEAIGYCHCQSCRSWSASPVNAFTLWKPENVKVTKGADRVAINAVPDWQHHPTTLSNFARYQAV
jgi:hypothetical protein